MMKFSQSDADPNSEEAHIDPEPRFPILVAGDFLPPQLLHDLQKSFPLTVLPGWGDLVTHAASPGDAATHHAQPDKPDPHATGVVIVPLPPDGRLAELLGPVRERHPSWAVLVVGDRDDSSVGGDAVRSGADKYLVSSRLSADYVALAIRYSIERKRAENQLKRSQEALTVSESRTRAIIETSLDCIMTVDDRGQVVDFNPAAEKTFGYTREEVEGREFASLVMTPETRDRQQRNIRAYLDDGFGSMLGNRIETKAFRKDGQPFIAELAMTPCESADETLFTIFVRDITERKKAEQELKHYARELERSNRDLDQFASVVAHDLSAPLRTVQNYCSMLQEDYGKDLNDDANDMIQHSVDATRRMYRLIDDLREYARVGCQPKKMAWVDANIIVKDVLASLASRIEQSGAIVRCEKLPMITGDPTQLGQLFQNLIENSMKYCDKSVPKVVIGADEQPGACVFTVRDNGIGIAPEHQERIFEIFRRLHTDDAYSGTGLGLAVCKRIVERHGGRIWVQSEPGKGSAFCFSVFSG